MGGLANLRQPATPADVTAAQTSINANVDASEVAVLAAISAGGEKAVSSLVGQQWGPANFNATTAIIADISQADFAFSGALTAGVLKTVIDITGGGGYLDIFAAVAVDGTAGDVRTQITLDGVVVLNKTMVMGISNYAHVGVGFTGTDNGTSTVKKIYPRPLRFNSSCKVEISAANTTTDKVGIVKAYRLTAA